MLIVAEPKSVMITLLGIVMLSINI